MALSKRSSLLVATLVVAGGVTIGAEVVKTNKQIENLELSIEQNKVKIESQSKELQKKTDELKKVQKSLSETEKSLEETKKSLEETKNTLEDTEKELKNTKSRLKDANNKLNSYNVSSYARNIDKEKDKHKEKGTPIQMTITFYGDGADENGGYAGITATGAKLQDGMVASNYYAFGTKFKLNGKVYTVSDRGGSSFNSPNKLDVFIPRRAGESTSAYKARIRKYGKRTVTMYKL